MIYRDLRDDAQPICPSCGITMHPLIDEGIEADECRDCGFRMAWADGRDADAEEDGSHDWW
ncbi:zf-TFIIB domain-containing protein [Microbacterium testaceum]|nr:zf-TFIIB domain-containing protein [Microbacterium testaceum]